MKRVVLAACLAVASVAMGVTADAASEVYGNFETLGVVADWLEVNYKRRSNNRPRSAG